MKISFFKLDKPRRFSYQPIFYDEANERRKERERQMRIELGMPPMEGDENRSAEERIRGKFTAARTYGNFDFRRKAQRTSNKRILVIAAILFMLIYLMYYSSGLERFISFFRF